MPNPSIIGHLKSSLARTFSDRSIVIDEIDKRSGIYTILYCTGHSFHIDSETNHKLGLFPIKVKDDNIVISVNK